MSTFLLRRVVRLAGLALCAYLVPAHSAPVITVIAEDSFAYTAGESVVGKNGGIGWSTPWELENVEYSRLLVDATGLTVPGVSSSGGGLVYVWNGFREVGNARRSLPQQDTGVVFVQFLSRFGNQSGLGSPTVRFGTAWVGNNNVCAGNRVYALFDNTAGVVECTTVPLATLSAVVLRIDYTAQTTQMWVLPSLSGFDYLNPPAPTVQRAGFAPVFSRFSLFARNPAFIDELRVFRVANVVPVPVTPQPVPANSWGALGAVSGLILVAGWWRRRRK